MIFFLYFVIINECYMQPCKGAYIILIMWSGDLFCTEIEKNYTLAVVRKRGSLCFTVIPPDLDRIAMIQLFLHDHNQN